jgi:hypothetical protein
MKSKGWTKVHSDSKSSTKNSVLGGILEPVSVDSGQRRERLTK